MGDVPERRPPPRGAVDTHLHPSMSAAAKPVFRGEMGAPLPRSPSTILVNQVDGRHLLAANVRLIIGSVWPPFRLRPGRDARAEALDQLEGLEAFCRRHPSFRIALDSASARRLIQRGFVAVVPGVEGGEGIQTLEDVDLYYAAGARSVTLVHFTSTHLGGAAKGQVGRLFGASANDLAAEGLTPFGREVVKRMMQLGIVVDLAHASDATAREVLEMAEAAKVPVINSHAAARALTPMERNISDELAVRIAKTGGTIGVTSYRGFLAGVPEGARIRNHVPETCDDLVAHWLHLGRTAGFEALVMGSDLNGFVTRPLPGGSCPNGLRHGGDFIELFSALEAHGVPRAALDGMLDRFFSTWEAVESRADPSLQAAARSRKVPVSNLFDVPL